MTTNTKHIGIDVCSGPTLTRAERMAAIGDRFAPQSTQKPATQAEPKATRPPAGE